MVKTSFDDAFKKKHDANRAIVAGRGKAGKVETPKHRIRHHKSKGALPWNWPPPRHHPNPGHLLLVGFASARKAEAHTEPRGDAASKPEHAMRLARATPGLSTSQPTPRSGKHSQGENQERRRRTHASKSRRRPAKQGANRHVAHRKPQRARRRLAIFGWHCNRRRLWPPGWSRWPPSSHGTLRSQIRP